MADSTSNTYAAVLSDLRQIAQLGEKRRQLIAQFQEEDARLAKRQQKLIDKVRPEFEGGCASHVLAGVTSKTLETDSRDMRLTVRVVGSTASKPSVVFGMPKGEAEVIKQAKKHKHLAHLVVAAHTKEVPEALNKDQLEHLSEKDRKLLGITRHEEWKPFTVEHKPKAPKGA